MVLALRQRLPHRHPETAGEADADQGKSRQQQTDVAPQLPVAEQEAGRQQVGQMGERQHPLLALPAQQQRCQEGR
ncbi:hypothetical protein D3C72_441130 [compost metagenome]